MANVSHSASLENIAAYLKRLHGCDQDTALREAREVLHNLMAMRQKGFINGWYFDERGHLELLPSDAVLKHINPPK